MENKTIIVSFSSRYNGNCGNIAGFIADNCPNSQVYRFSDFQIHPCGACHYECFNQRESCPYFDDIEYKLLDDICGSEMAYFVVPNYCDYPCANFFIFNERSQCYFQGRPELLERYLDVPKKFVVISNGGQQNFRETFMQHTAEEPIILFLSAKHYNQNSINGKLLDSNRARADLNAFLGSKILY